MNIPQKGLWPPTANQGVSAGNKDSQKATRADHSPATGASPSSWAAEARYAGKAGSRWLPDPITALPYLPAPQTHRASCFVPKPRSTHRQICRKIQLNFPKKYFRKCLQSYELMNFNLTSHFPEHQPSDMRPIASTPPCGIKTTHRYKTRREGQPFLTVQVHVAGILMATLQKTTKGRY